MLKTRIKTAAVLIPLLVILLCISHYPYVMEIFISLLSVCGVYELYKATNLTDKELPFAVSLVVGAVIPFVKIPYYMPVITVSFLISVTVFLLLMKFFGKYQLNKIYKVFPISLMIPLFYSSFVHIRSLDKGLYFLVLFVLVCIITDTAAYFVGRAMGKHKLAPNVSPKKTVEGSIGGSACAVIIVLVIGLVLDLVTSLNINYLWLGIYTLLASVIDQIGDLAMSVIKRTVGIKDYSDLMPGHGGVLDRFDSYMFVAPFTLIFYYYINHMIF